MILASLWTIWSGLQWAGLLPKLPSYQFAALLSVLLFVGTLYDWVKCVWGKRPMLSDLLVVSAIVGVLLSLTYEVSFNRTASPLSYYLERPAEGD